MTETPIVNRVGEPDPGDGKALETIRDLKEVDLVIQSARIVFDRRTTTRN